MIDVEQELSEALHAYAASVAPSAPPVDAVDSVVLNVFADQPGPRHRDLRLVMAAVLVFAVSGIVLWSVRGDHSATDVGPAPTVIAPLNVGSWKTVPKGPLSARKLPSVLWTGHEFIVWGGQQDNVGLADGAAYDPSKATWRMIRANPRAQAGANAVWTGSRMVVLARGGGESYDPATDSWSSLPPIDVSASGSGGGGGFTSAVWTGTQLLGFGVEELKDQGNTFVLRVWTLAQGGTVWSPPAAVAITTGRPTMHSFAYYPDQFEVFSAVSIADGLVVWDGASDGWRYSTTTGGWSKLATLTTPTGAVVDSAVTWLGDHLLAVDSISANGDRLELATLEDNGWSPLRQASNSYMGLANPITVGERVVVLGVNGMAPGTPLLIDPTTSQVAAMTGYPIATTIDQGAAWSGKQLFVWGGQTPTTSSSGTTPAGVAGQPPMSTDSPISDQGAIWQP